MNTIKYATVMQKVLLATLIAAIVYIFIRKITKPVRGRFTEGPAKVVPPFVLKREEKKKPVDVGMSFDAILEKFNPENPINRVPPPEMPEKVRVVYKSANEIVLYDERDYASGKYEEAKSLETGSLERDSLRNPDDHSVFSHEDILNAVGEAYRKKEETASAMSELFNNPQRLREAFIASQIFERRHF